MGKKSSHLSLSAHFEFSLIVDIQVIYFDIKWLSIIGLIKLYK